MLTKANSGHIDKISAFCQNSTLGTRVLSYAECYGFERDFIDFYIYEDSDELKGVLMRFDNSITVITKEYDFPDEITAFIEMLSCDVVMSDRVFSSEFYILQNEKQAFIYDGCSNNETAQNLGEESLKLMYRLISESIPDSFQDTQEAFLSFLSDFIFRKMRFRSRAKGIFDEDTSLIACALTSAETDKSAIISGVACDKNKRSKGTGKQVVLSLTNELVCENKKVYVIALNSSAEGFYEHIGFNRFEKIFYFGRKN